MTFVGRVCVCVCEDRLSIIFGILKRETSLGNRGNVALVRRSRLYMEIINYDQD